MKHCLREDYYADRKMHCANKTETTCRKGPAIHRNVNGNLYFGSRGLMWAFSVVAHSMCCAFGDAILLNMVVKHELPNMTKVSGHLTITSLHVLGTAYFCAKVLLLQTSRPTFL